MHGINRISPGGLHYHACGIGIHSLTLCPTILVLRARGSGVRTACYSTQDEREDNVYPCPGHALAPT